jgi:hypothetical protein
MGVVALCPRPSVYLDDHFSILGLASGDAYSGLGTTGVPDTITHPCRAGSQWHHRYYMVA